MPALILQNALQSMLETETKEVKANMKAAVDTCPTSIVSLVENTKLMTQMYSSSRRLALEARNTIIKKNWYSYFQVLQFMLEAIKEGVTKRFTAIDKVRPPFKVYFNFVGNE